MQSENKVLHRLMSATVLALLLPGGFPAGEPNSSPQPLAEVKLPNPRLKGEVSVEEALLKRRSVRDYRDEPLTKGEVSQLLWAAQGVTNPQGFRTAPSAGATYPLETYLVVGRVEQMGPGLYRYDSAKHQLMKLNNQDVRAELAAAALGQEWIKEAAVDIVFTAVYERTTRRYGDRGKRYVHMEAGHAAQHVYLEAVALELGTVVVGAFYDDRVKRVLSLPKDERPLYIMPVGRPG